jgi:hypothetical protein
MRACMLRHPAVHAACSHVMVCMRTCSKPAIAPAHLLHIHRMLEVLIAIRKQLRCLLMLCLWCSLCGSRGTV